MALTPSIEKALDQTLATLQQRLGENLSFCALYGSAVRGDLVPGVSDLNLLIVLNESTPEAHAAIAEALRGGGATFSPFVLGRVGLERSIRAFLIKFLSIQRNYRPLFGTDPLKDLEVDASLVRFLCEQALRNLRLRLVNAYIVFGDNRKRYTQYVSASSAALFTDIAEPLRCAGIDVPPDYAARIPIFEREFKTDAQILRRMLELRAQPRTLTAAEVADFHGCLFRLLNDVVQWTENQWPTTPSRSA